MAVRGNAGRNRRPGATGGSRRASRPTEEEAPRVATRESGRREGGSARRPSRSTRPAASRFAPPRGNAVARDESRRAAARAAERRSPRYAAPSGPQAAGDAPEFVSASIGELRREARLERAKKKSRRYLIRLVAIVGTVVALLAGWAALYNSPAFSIENVTVNGVEHLTGDEMAQLANVPADTTLLRVDADTIARRVEQNAWVADAQVNRVFPDTLEINVTERPLSAVVEILSSGGATVKQWAISDDHVWLMPIPDIASDAAKTTSAKVYEDASAALHIVDVPYGTKAEIGQVCSDANVNNALDIISGMTTELAGRVVKVSAAGTAETTLVLDNGVEIAFGKAEDIRDKERVILQILEENADNVAYINVRMVETPTWRAV